MTVTPCGADSLRRIGAAMEGVYRDTTMDGVEVYVAFQRAPSSGWTAAITAPVAALDGPVRHSMLLMIGLGLALILVSGAGAFVVARRVSRSIESAASAADALAHGGRPGVEPALVEEVAHLVEALERSAEQLSHRERERDEHLARAEASRIEQEAANRAKDEFLAMLGHELRNPLSAITSASSMLKIKVASAEATAKMAAIIHRQSEHLRSILDDLLDLSRISRGRITLRRERIPLEAAVQQAFVTGVCQHMGA